jgi:proline racemase
VEDNADWQHFSFCLFAGPITRVGRHLTTSATVAIQPGKIDRSPTGTAASARMALLHERGEMLVGETFTARSIINSEFHGRIVETTAVGDVPAIIPEITGHAWITGTHQHMLDPNDPWPEGYRLSDTWPDLKGPKNGEYEHSVSVSGRFDRVWV